MHVAWASAPWSLFLLLHEEVTVCFSVGACLWHERSCTSARRRAQQQAIHAPPLHSTCAAVLPQGTCGAPVCFDAPSAGILSPRGGDDRYNYGLPQASANPPLPEAGCFTRPAFAPTGLKPAESCVSAAQDKLGSAFATKEGQWDCNISAVRNEPAAPKCAALQNANKTRSAVSLQELSFQLDGKTPACTSQNLADAEAEPAEGRCNFSVWMPPGGFKFGIEECNTNCAKEDDPPKERTAGLTNMDGKDKNELPSGGGVTLQSQETANRDKSEPSCEKGTWITAHVSGTNAAKASPCGANSVAVLEEATREHSDLSHGGDGSDAAVEASEALSTCETPRKTVVSAPKFVLRSECVKSVFSNEKTFPSGKTSAIGSLFGFGFNPPGRSADGI